MLKKRYLCSFLIVVRKIVMEHATNRTTRRNITEYDFVNSAKEW